MGRLLLILSLLGLSLNCLAQTGRITGNFSNVPFPEFVASVEQQTGYRFYFEPADVTALFVTVDASQQPLASVLEVIFSGKGIFFIIDDQKNVILTKDKPIIAGFNDADPARSTSLLSAPEDDGNRTENLIALQERKTFEIGRASSVQKATLSGFVTVAGATTPVAGASIAVTGTTSGTVTDDKGYYSLTLTPGNYQLRISSVGLKTTTRNIILRSDGKLNIDMVVAVTNLQELVVTAGKTSNVKGLQMGMDRLDMQAIKYMPTTFGEADVLKAVLTLPGVKTIGEASSGFNVRGGAADQNLILFNESTIYNPFHFFGFFSSFSAETIQDVELYKSVIPANYGGRLSSVLKVTGRRGDKEKIKGSAGLGVLTSRINLEGPIIKDKTSFAVGARTTYSNWLFTLLPENSGYKNSEASFYDVNLNLDHTLGTSGNIMFNAYLSNDKSNLNTDTSFAYTNRNFSLVWSQEFNEQLAGQFSVGHDHYDYGNSSRSNPQTAYELAFAIDQATFKANFAYAWNSKTTLQFGVNSIYYRLEPGALLPGESSELARQVISTEQALESALFADVKYDITSRLSVQGGVRYSLFNYLGPKDVNNYAEGLPKNEENKTGTQHYDNNEIIKTYQGPEFRLSSRYTLTQTLSVKAGYSTMRQYIHMLSNTVAISPTDIWKLSDPNVKPQFSEQISLGLYKNFSKWETSVEVYSKRIKDYLDYKSGAVLVMNPAVETEFITTKGKGYGLELMLKKPTGKFNGWISYTYSRILLKIDDPNAGENINNGNYYPASYDKPHDFNFTGNQKITRRFSVSLNLNYSTGRPVTVPIGVFMFGNSQKTLYSTRNGYRIPDYFRTDIALNLDGNHNRRQRFHNSWTVGVYNLTARKNPYSVYFTTENGVVNGYKLSIFGAAIPYINFNIRF